MAKWTKIKVDKSIKPIPFRLRKEVNLNVGDDYFISFGNNEAYKCKLINIIETGNMKQVEIEVPIRARSKNGFIDENGKVSHNWVDYFTVYSDEIGLTAEEAVINEVTF